MTTTCSATHEVTTKTDARIERETARKWADRALACYAKAQATGQCRWLLRAEDYRHEALEHAALIGDGGKTVGVLEREFAPLRGVAKRARPRKHR